MEETLSAPAPRVPLELRVEYRRSYARQARAGTLKNVSLSGAYLEDVNGDLTQKDKLLLELNVGGRTRKLHATVIWRNDGGAGIKFHHHHNRDLQLIDDLIYFVETSRNTRRSVLDTIFNKVS